MNKQTHSNESIVADEILVTSAIPLDTTQLTKIAGIVNSYLHRNLPVKNSVNKNVLGGFEVHVGDFFLDASLAHELSMVKRVLTN